MTLRHLTIPKAAILVGGEPFVVSGVTASQVFTLYRRHKADLSTLFDNLSGRATIEAGDVMNSVEGIIAMFPDLVGEVIALASGVSPDSPELDEEVAIAKSLPVAYQVEALEKIGELTFSPEMPPKKFFGLLVAMVQQVNQKKPTLEVGSGN